MPDFIAVFGRLHPMLLHLPMGLLIGIATLELYAWRKGTKTSPKILVNLTAITTILAMASGLILHEEPTYQSSETLELHERLGLITTFATCCAAVFHSRRSEKKYRISLSIAVLAMIPGGHFGGSMTHGEGFITEPLTKKEPRELPEEINKSNPITANYTKNIAPILEARCNSCHGERKQKGELRLDSPEWILSGGYSGTAITVGDSEDSEIVYRMRLPLEDEDRMPPEHKRQPTENQIHLIEMWINAGAPFDKDFALQEGLVLPEPSLAPQDEPLIPASIKALENLRSRQIHVQKISADSEELWVDCAAAAKNIGDREIKDLLTPLEDHISDLSLARTQITDKAMVKIADFTRIRRLDLRKTKITDTGLKQLKNTESIEQINLSRTLITDASIPLLQNLPKLKKIWLWESQISAKGIEILRKRLEVEAGDSPTPTALEVEGEINLTSDAPSIDGLEKDSERLVPENKSCPISGEPIDPNYTILFKGKAIGFCCPNCPKNFWEENN